LDEKKPSIKVAHIQSTPLKTHLDRHYWIKLPVSDNKWKLEVVPRKSAYQSTDDDNTTTPLVLYVQVGDWVALPRFYGQNVYGPPQRTQLSEGDPMQSGMEFQTQLHNNPSKPQQQAAQAWLDRGGEGIICLPCGMGKTVVALYCALMKARKTLILVHNEGLMNQWRERITQFIPLARIKIFRQALQDTSDCDFVLGMLQSVSKVAQPLDEFGLVIVDECHHIAARTFAVAVRKTRPRYLLGLSATPTRPDGLTSVIEWLLGPVVYRATRQDLYPMTVFAVTYQGGAQKEVTYRGGQIGQPTMINLLVQEMARNRVVLMSIERLIEHYGVRKMLILSGMYPSGVWLVCNTIVFGFDQESGLTRSQIDANISRRCMKPVRRFFPTGADCTWVA
jgi:hypothetical protein